MSAPVITHVEQTPAVTSLRSKDLLGIADMAPDEISPGDRSAMPSRSFRLSAVTAGFSSTGVT